MSNDELADEFNDLDEIAEGGQSPEPVASGGLEPAKSKGSEVVNGVEIDYDVPIPTQSAAGGGPNPKWPWHAVHVGGSIKFRDPKQANSAVSSAKRWAKRNPLEDGSLPEFVRRATGTYDNPEFRVFRIK